MARLYSNENFPIPVVEELRKLGHDVLTVQESGKSGQALSDEAVLAFACAEGRICSLSIASNFSVYITKIMITQELLPVVSILIL